MAKNKVTSKVIAEEESPAADTIEAKPSDASRAQMMAQATTQMASMDKSTLSQVLAIMNSKEFAKNIPDNAADQNRQTVAAKGAAMSQAMKEDVAELFSSEQLSEDFKQKTTVLFESAVTARVAAATVEIEEQYNQKLEQEIASVTEVLGQQIDQYLSYVAEQWVKENEVAIEKSLKSDLTESFINGLQRLFAEHYVTIPDDQVDIVESLVDQIDQLETRLNEQISTNVEMAEVLESYGKQEVFDEVAQGLAMTQVDKFSQLAETVEFGDVDTYKKKLEIIKEHHFGTKAKPTNLNEQVDQEDNSQPTVKYTSPLIENYAKAISRTIKK